jgi:hypothetical protein
MRTSDEDGVTGTDPIAERTARSLEQLAVARRRPYSDATDDAADRDRYNAGIDAAADAQVRIPRLSQLLVSTHQRQCSTRRPSSSTPAAEVTTDRAPVYPRVLDELIPAALHTVEQYANNPIEADHGG